MVKKGQNETRRLTKAFTLIELLVVVGIIAVLAVLAVPRFIALAENAKEAATQANMNVVAETVQGCMVRYDKNHWYAPRSSGTSYDYSDSSINNYLEGLFEDNSEPTNDYSYVNQYSGSKVILNWTSSIGGEGLDPAVFFTNTTKYSYDNSTPSNMSQLKGTIVVYFATEDGTTTHIEIYCTDKQGDKCDDPIILTM
jgi:type IV pilus assembly protein PilA